MLISKKFVFIHPPKTGGSSVRSRLFAARRNFMRGGPAAARVAGVAFSPLKNTSLSWIKDKALNFLCPEFPLTPGMDKHHSGCSAIPERHRHKQILSTVRDPLAYYLSCYMSARRVDGAGAWNWLKAYQQVEDRREGIPDFDEFLRFYNEVLPARVFSGRGVHVRSSIGFLTCCYIWFFFRNWREVLGKDDEELEAYFDSGEHEKDMYPVTFLCTENLNRNLHDWFAGMGFDERRLDFVLHHRKVNAATPEKVSSYCTVESVYNEELTDYVKKKDRFYYRCFYEPNSKT